jgi:hypothetical protein
MIKRVLYWTICFLVLAVGIRAAIDPDAAYLFMRLHWRLMGSVFFLLLAAWSQLGYQNLKTASLLVTGASLLAYLPGF